jgi:hypothetical protein
VQKASIHANLQLFENNEKQSSLKFSYLVFFKLDLNILLLKYLLEKYSSKNEKIAFGKVFITNV